MRIPKDISLRKYILHLIEIDKVERFYQTEDWKELRQEVLDFFHNECQECLKNGVLTTYDLCVHHVNELRDKPEWALSKYYMDNEGNQQPNLVPLCKTCHNIIHEKLYKYSRKDKFENKERW